MPVSHILTGLCQVLNNLAISNESIFYSFSFISQYAFVVLLCGHKKKKRLGRINKNLQCVLGMSGSRSFELREL